MWTSRLLGQACLCAHVQASVHAKCEATRKAALKDDTVWITACLSDACFLQCLSFSITHHKETERPGKQKHVAELTRTAQEQSPTCFLTVSKI